MFESAEDRAPGHGAGADYGYVRPLAPGAVDPVRLAALLDGVDAGALLWDPAEEALFGPEPEVDVAALFAALEATGSAPADAVDGLDAPSVDPGRPVAGGGGVRADVVEPAVLVPAHLPTVEDMPPGPGLAAALDAAGLPELGAYELVEAVAGWQRIASWVAARQATAIMELSRRAEMQPVQEGRRIESMSPLRVTGVEVAARLTLTPRDGERLAARAVVWCEDLPATWAALEQGRIDVRRAEVIADTLRGHPLALARAVEAAVLERAETLTAPRLRRAIENTLHRLAPQPMEQRQRAATQRRFVRFEPVADGMTWLEAYLPAEDAAALQTAVQAAAAAMKRVDPGDGRSMDNRRADALAQMGWLALAAGRLGGCPCGQRLDTQHRRPVSVQVTVPISMLLGLDDQQPSELAGYGPITAEVARRLAAHGTWRRLVTDPMSGTLLDYGRTRYEPPPDLVDHVVARDRTCRFPGCERPAPACDIDHTLPYPQGATAADDLGPFCEPHHIGKHHTRWKVRQPEPGRFEWTSPTGHLYTINPEPVGPIHDDTDKADPDPPADDPDPPVEIPDVEPLDEPPF